MNMSMLTKQMNYFSFSHGLKTDQRSTTNTAFAISIIICKTTLEIFPAVYDTNLMSGFRATSCDVSRR